MDTKIQWLFVSIAGVLAVAVIGVLSFDKMTSNGPGGLAVQQQPAFAQKQINPNKPAKANLKGSWAGWSDGNDGKRFAENEVKLTKFNISQLEPRWEAHLGEAGPHNHLSQAAGDIVTITNDDLLNVVDGDRGLLAKLQDALTPDPQIAYAHDTNVGSGSAEVANTPLVIDNTVYLSDFSGHVRAYKANSGKAVWQGHFDDDYSVHDHNDGDPGHHGVHAADDEEHGAHEMFLSRNTPGYDPATEYLFLGDQLDLNPLILGAFGVPGFPKVYFNEDDCVSTPTNPCTSLHDLHGYDGADLVAIDRFTGERVWSTKLDENPLAIVTQSPIVHNGIVYVGVSSMEELGASLILGYECCSFIGSVVALDAATGHILWTTKMAPELPHDGLPGHSHSPSVPAVHQHQYSGNAVWGGSPQIDPVRGQVRVATGNLYDAPYDITECWGDFEDDLDPTDPSTFGTCTVADNHNEAIVAMDLLTGHIDWSTKLGATDVWNVACGGVLPVNPNPENCPVNQGPDHDFGTSPIQWTATIDGDQVELVGAGQKSGLFWAVRADNGDVVWVTRTGPGGLTGGHIFGDAADNDRIYTSNSNSDGDTWTLVNHPSGTPATTTGGFWGALDMDDGHIIWQTADPQGSTVIGTPTTANGMLFTASNDSGPDSGTIHIFDGSNGVELFTAAGGQGWGPAIVDGIVFWGEGNGRSASPTDKNHLTAWSLPNDVGAANAYTNEMMDNQ